jgi:hypothetical protein
VCNLVFEAAVFMVGVCLPRICHVHILARHRVRPRGSGKAVVRDQSLVILECPAEPESYDFMTLVGNLQFASTILGWCLIQPAAWSAQRMTSAKLSEAFCGPTN